LQIAKKAPPLRGWRLFSFFARAAALRQGRFLAVKGVALALCFWRQTLDFIGVAGCQQKK
jgi:hypothetical protein